MVKPLSVLELTSTASTTHHRDNNSNNT